MPQTIIDKIKTSGWFRAISRDIERTLPNWPPEDRPEIEARVERYMATATRLEDEAQAEIIALH
jgi:hypothetical protein